MYIITLNFIVTKKSITLYRTTGYFTEEHEKNEEGDSYLNVDSDGCEGDEVIM